MACFRSRPASTVGSNKTWHEAAVRRMLCSIDPGSKGILLQQMHPKKHRPSTGTSSPSSTRHKQHAINSRPLMAAQTQHVHCIPAGGGHAGHQQIKMHCDVKCPADVIYMLYAPRCGGRSLPVTFGTGSCQDISYKAGGSANLWMNTLLCS